MIVSYICLIGLSGGFDKTQDSTIGLASVAFMLWVFSLPSLFPRRTDAFSSIQPLLRLLRHGLDSSRVLILDRDPPLLVRDSFFLFPSVSSSFLPEKLHSDSFLTA